MYICLLCEKHFPEIPVGAIVVRKGMGSHTIYKFADGSVHDLRNPEGFQRRTHDRYHQYRKRPDCVICNPEPQEQTALDAEGNKSNANI